MNRARLSPLLLAASALAACGGGGSNSAALLPDKCAVTAPEDRLAECSKPTLDPAYYVEQSLKYFDTLDSTVPIDVVPNYSELVARWEWPPWLKLTGYTRDGMILTDILLKLFPTRIPERDCRFFPTQPFGRCYVNFDYDGDPCPIYEEFTFNDAGEMTFIEAWTDYPGFLPMADPADRWGEGETSRLATRVPGLGSPDGRIDLESPAMLEAAAADPDVEDFVVHARDPFFTWIADLLAADPDFFAYGCDPGGARAVLPPKGR
ncbi:MAG: hypothetical protein K8I02_11710 [Candidatus Methylomirabilis sp.]|nr:hypothetical protein [Deltaproteobacteria bacterium]